MRRCDAHVLGHRQRPESGGVTRAEIAIDVIEGQARIGKGTCGDFGVYLCNGLAGNGAQRVLEDPRDERLSPERHASEANQRGVVTGRHLAMGVV